jgi:hypothetical protein
LCDMLFMPDGEARVCYGASKAGGRKPIEVGDPVYIITKLGAYAPGVDHLCPECYAQLATPALAIVKGLMDYIARIPHVD